MWFKAGFINVKSEILLIPFCAQLLRRVMNGFWAPLGFFSPFFWLTRGFLMYYSGTVSSPCCSVNPWETSTVKPPWSHTSPTLQPTTWRRWPRCSWPHASTAWGRRRTRYTKVTAQSRRGAFTAGKRSNIDIYQTNQTVWWFICQLILKWTRGQDNKEIAYFTST